MNKKGFTLVELLAVIVILAIILAIAVPAISSFIENSKIDVMKNNEKLMIKAAKNYLAVNTSQYPTNIGDVSEISLSSLQSSNYISAITSPLDSGKICTGYLLVTKIGDGDYDYSPHLNCESNISSLNDDGLVASYAFNDFQQPTTNLLTNPLDFYWNIWPEATYGWSYSTQSLASDLDNEGKMRKIIINAGTTAVGSYFQIFSGNLSITSGKTYALSFYAKAKVGRRIALSMIKNGTPYTTYVSGGTTIDVGTQWKRYEVIFVSSYTATDARIQISTGMDLWNDELYLYKPQLEYRSVTPFINGTRSGSVKDYSGKGNVGSLQVDYTPKWIQGHNYGGGYEFDGVDDYVELTDSVDLRMINGGTISAWIYPRTTGISGAGRVLDKSTDTSGANGYLICLGSNNIVQFRVNGGAPLVSSNNALTLNAWNHVVVTFNSSGRQLYVNGVNVGSDLTTITLPPNVAGVVRIGNRVGTGDRAFDGFIDDVKFYNRVLTATEVKNNYNVEK